MTQPDSRLDQFESALLTELRRYAAEQPAPAPVPVRRRRRLAAVSLTGLAAGTAAVVALTTLGGSPAYAVNTNADGDVVVTVHRLDDAAGLEKALSDKGIDAEVSYDADGSDGSFSISSVDEPDGQEPQGEGGQSTSEGEFGAKVESGGQNGDDTGPSASGPRVQDNACGPLDPAPATLARDGGDWVLTIPAGSPLHDRHVDIGTDPSGALAVQYAGSVPGSSCGVMTMGAP